eukprot:1160741-Pelagomonas_calceolata.AAC.14
MAMAQAPSHQMWGLLDSRILQGHELLRTPILVCKDARLLPVFILARCGMSVACTGYTLLLHAKTCKVHYPPHSLKTCSPEAYEVQPQPHCFYDEDMLNNHKSLTIRKRCCSKRADWLPCPAAAAALLHWRENVTEGFPAIDDSQAL